MSIGNYELANLFAVLSVGREMDWTDQVDGNGDPTTTDAPTSASDGVSLAAKVTKGTPSAGFRCQLRRQAWRRSCRMIPTNIVVGDTFRFTIPSVGDVDYVVAGGDDADAIIDGLIAALPGVGAVDALVTFEGRNDADENTAPFTKLYVATKAEASQPFAGSILGGGGSTFDPKCDAEGASLRMWGCDFDTNFAADADTWQLINNGDFTGIDFRGKRERAVTGGVARLYGEYYDVTGDANDDGTGTGCTLTYDPHFWVGPAIEEE
jgi:hypothetical protein